ncbi:hypothetical protein COT98_03435 [Candidatus Falkowbacteria bacterium CG10_big_fil_rev_8_21_14_0_10_39_9]|uniref:Bacterial spore germination immunoglobulin-like domain-containing protein n=1 Tax=Candidatus Falkowbacteria bacterium CG10_big_fil_rev_8_21_14_0_10_39_9 TaxID=1974566 RepID=A0A2M6WNX0_9BACT|nr:MAG: hypothetical protein COT98_03435 [Candidatus Falkowbacteria bacterium CG10_big_fil_rev_8_21_14_0_10_39_9]
MKNLKTEVIKKTKPKAKTKALPKSSPKFDVLETCSCCDRGNGVHYGKVFFGLVLVLFGLFYLGRNLGFWPAFNFNLQAIWPVLLIVIGLWLVNRRARISILVGVFSALVFMMILAFIVSFAQISTEYADEAVMPILPHIERVKATSTPAQTEDLKLNNFVINQVISSPVALEGSARGTWFFEGSFPVKLLDESGQELGRGIAQSQGNWMTEDFVPFKVTMMFTRPTSSTGSLVLEKDNPSGLLENDKKVSFPVKF